MYEKTLSKAGLSEKQAQVYLACLELGHAKAPEIAQKSEIKRTTTYGILDELVSMGLVSYVQQGKSKIFKAQNPKTILGIVESNKKELEGIIPDLELLFSHFHLKPRVQFFEGKKGVKRIFEDTLTCRSKKIFQIVKVKEWQKLLTHEYATEYIRDRAERGIWSYAIHPKSGDIYDEPYATQSTKWKRYARYLPPSMFYASMIIIYDHKLAMISTKEENFGFIIESKEFSNTFRAYFDFMWNVGSKQPEK